MLYLDNSATTQMLPQVKEAMLPYLLQEYGNPSSKYYPLATNAKNAVNVARQAIATLLSCDSEEIIFTSGATESNNMIIKGVADFYGHINNHIVTTKIEHPSVLEVCRFLETKGYKITYLDVDRYGRINLDDLIRIFRETPPILVSIMWGNNEIGSLQPIKEISDLCYENNILFHTDATQVVGKVNVNIDELPGLRFLSCSAHKFHGPKGIGVAVIRKDNNGLKTKITPLLHGGGQEMDYRSGTHAVHNIIGMGKAAELAYIHLEKNIEKLIHLEAYLQEILKEKFGEVLRFNHDSTNKIPGILSIEFTGINNEQLIKKLSPYMALSTGSACSSSKPSHVLEAMGLPLESIRSTVRISLSHLNTLEELNIFKKL